MGKWGVVCHDVFLFQAEDGIRGLVRSRGLGDVYKRQTHRRYVEPFPLLPPYPSAVPGAYNLEGQVYRGYWMVSWFKQEFGHHESEAARARGLEPEAVSYTHLTLTTTHSV